LNGASAQAKADFQWLFNGPWAQGCLSQF